MARFKRTTRARFRRTRRRHNDVVPISLCRDPLVMPFPGPYNCVDPFTFAVPLVDGGALQNILKQAASAAVIPEDYNTSQGMSRGISFHGCQFDFVWGFQGDPNQSFNNNAGFTTFTVTAAFGLVKIETQPDPVTAVRTPVRIPNLFSPDEQLAGDYLYRWHSRLPLWTVGTSADQPVSTGIFTDSTGMLLSTFCYQETTNCYLTVGTGSHTQIRHRVKSKRFLDEDHAIYLVGALACPVDQSDIATFSIDMLGYMALMGR